MPPTGPASRHRHHQYLERHQFLPHASARPRGGREAWRLPGWRLPARTAGDVAAEPFVKPSTTLYRNLLAMETEELLRSHPIDGAVLMGGCDKTTPA